jgi:hypothetical protein
MLDPSAGKIIIGRREEQATRLTLKMKIINIRQVPKEGRVSQA